MLQRSRGIRPVPNIASTIIAAVSLVFMPCCAPGGSADAAAVEPTPQQATEQTPSERNALFACIAATERNLQGDDLSGAEAQLRNPDNRIEGQDWSGQDLSGKNFGGKVFVGVKLTGAKLKGADLTDAIICRSDLNGADLSGARLDRVLIGGGTEMKSTNLANVSGHALKIADAIAWEIRIDGADLRGASLSCNEGARCFGNGVTFASMAGADLRGATIDVLSMSPPSLGAAHLDQVTTHLVDGLDLAQLASGAGESGRITFLPWYGHSGIKTEFTSGELRQLASVLPQMQPASAHPSFDCSRARTDVEKAICADPKLAALDSALNWLWKKIKHTPQEIAAQRKWSSSRATCRPPDDDLSVPLSSDSFISSSDPKGCIGIAYAERIRALAPKSSSAVFGNGTYTTDPPLELPIAQYSGLVRKFLMAKGYREDEIVVESLGKGAGKISGFGVWANGHQCGFDASEAQTGRIGARFRINDDSAAPDEKYSVSFVITPQVIIRAGGAKQFQCGARGRWSDIYFRQPDELISNSKNLRAAHSGRLLRPNHLQ